VVSLSPSPLTEHGRECLDYIEFKRVARPGLTLEAMSRTPRGVDATAAQRLGSGQTSGPDDP